MHWSARRLATTLLLLSIALSAHAGATRLRWSACAGDGGTENRDFACNTNSGSDVLVASFVPTDAVTGVVSLRGIIFGAVAGASVPAWWHFRTAGSCRINSFPVGGAAPASAVNCIEWSDGPRSTSSVYTVGTFISNGIKLDVTTPVLGFTPFDLSAGQEYFAFTATLLHTNTVGTGACGGCTQPACLVLQTVQLQRNSPDPNVTLSGLGGVRQDTVLWQGGAGVAVPNFGGAGFTYCAGSTRARASTWGSVKALYR